MRIISKFHDYYDNAGQVDFSFPWNRKEIEDESLTRYGWTSPSGKDIDRTITIMFCGKTYFGVQLPTEKPKNGNWKYEWFWGDKLLDRIEGNKVWKGMYSLHHGIQNCHDINLEYNSPIIAIEGRDYWNHTTAYVNANLGRYDFAKQINPYDARQMIETFLRNDLAVEMKPQQLDDKYRIAAHGFDKWSFRKDTPPTRKQK